MRSLAGRVWRCMTARARLIDVWLVGLLVLSVNRPSLVAGRAFPDNRRNVVPPALPLNPCVCRAVLADTVETGRAPHAAQRGSRRLLGS